MRYQSMEFVGVLKIMELDISDNRLSVRKKAIPIIPTLLPAQG